MILTKLKMNDIAYFIHGQRLVKGVVDEIVVHYQQEKTVVKYMIRPYGINKFVTIDEDCVYGNIDEPKEKILEDLRVKYTKANIKHNYKLAKKEMRSKFEVEMAKFDENSRMIEETINNISDEYYDNLEKERLEKAEQETEEK